MKILFPYLARWHSANRSRYHQLLTHLCRRGHQVFLLTAPPMAIGDISQDLPAANCTPSTAVHQLLPEGMSLDEIHGPPPLDRFWQWGGPRTKLLKKGILALASIPQIRRTLREQKIDLLFLYNLPQVPLLDLVDCPIHFDLADDLVAMMEGEGCNVQVGSSTKHLGYISCNILAASGLFNTLMSSMYRYQSISGE